MKFSTRNELLKEADKTLLEIKTKIQSKKVNELDWKYHKQSVDLRKQPTTQSYISGQLAFMYSKELERINKKYRSIIGLSDNKEQVKQKEINELLQLISKLREHMSRSNIEIPSDPTKRTKFQQELMDSPELDNEKFKQDPHGYLKTFLKQDPDTKLWWDARTGLPATPPEFWDYGVEWYNYYYNKIPNTWDYNRSWIYNIFKKIYEFYRDTPSS